MSNTIIFAVLAVIVLIAAIAFIILTVQKSDDGRNTSNKSIERLISSEYISNDFRSKKIKCHRCGGEAFGIFGTGNIYRCRPCGAKTRVAMQ